MAAPKGNQYNKKLKSKEIKEKVYKNYCEHISKGYSHKSWCYEKDGLTLTWETIESYIKNDEDFDASHKEVAVSKSLKIFEDWGKKMMLGEIKNGQPAIYQIFMRNKFKWDRNDTATAENKEGFNKWLGSVKSKKSYKNDKVVKMEING